MVTSMIGAWATSMPVRGSRIIAGENFIVSRPMFAKFVIVVSSIVVQFTDRQGLIHSVFATMGYVSTGKQRDM